MILFCVRSKFIKLSLCLKEEELVGLEIYKIVIFGLVCFFF